VDKNTQNISDLGERLTAVELTKANRNQGQWISPTLLNGWVNFGGSEAIIGFYKDELGMVRLKGTIKSGTATAGTTLFYLPVGYRPLEKIPFAVDSNGAYGRIDILSSGAVQIQAGVSGALTLNNITFRAEQ
jgi:hypothetical protein